MNTEAVQINQNISTPNRIRLAVSLFYFGQGVCFASWASRIPDIKHTLNLSDAMLGSILLALPLGQLITMPISGRLVTKYGSKTMLTATVPFYALALTNFGIAAAGWQLALFLFLWGVIGNMCNISLNTQGVVAEQAYGKPIMSSFHGAWSLGGFTGALLGLVFINFGQAPYAHFWIVTLILWLNIFFNFKHLAIGTKPAVAEKKAKGFNKPDKVLIQLGIIGFCSMATEGAMFDWSGIYFKDIVNAPAAYVVLGYASFMIMMAAGRFLGDKMITRFGRKRWLQFSGVMISLGMFVSVTFPYLVPATIGFMLVGLGVSGVVPMVYTIAGNNKKVSPGMALAMVSGVSYFGFLLGPPLIGYISALANLRYSYAIIGCFGILIALLVTKIKAIK
ncbi:fucose permease [Arcticibacter pallidicorallinus]|uniref:Fucose permease n=1 Tax=Arcticibacter pallidicorallinus TaxID=1259464 RepID=A0A2T0U0R2_9SPHI|nr:MFS transporter [Arcticibacter pallidicorallinus]PRY51483.1 fucose permease [Arcticibacter pallidicorallinus]